MKRRIIVAAFAAMCLAAMAAPAQAADPTIVSQTQVGHISGIFRNPNNSAQYVNWAVAIDLASTDADEATEFFSPVGRVSQGNGMVREQIPNIRSGIGARVVNDYFPSANPLARNNTDPGCMETIPPGPGQNVVTRNLYDERVQTGACESAADRFKNPLHNTADYEPDTTLVRGFSDWLATDLQNCPTVGARVFFEVRFAGDPNVYAFNRRTPDVNSNGPACP